ncbi:MAG: hypothetical protein AMXMBFR49_21390 [Chlorobiota bacterium]|nr:MAG: hypothetical protein EDM75_03125 [Chlorobiota bacterium]
MAKLYFSFLFMVMIPGMVFGQFKDEQYDTKDMTSSKTFFTLGYLTTHEDLPPRFGNGIREQKGVILGWKYNVATVEDFDIYGLAKTRLAIGGSTNFGFTGGSGFLHLPKARQIIQLPEVIENFAVKTYTGTFDLFSLNLNFQTFLIFPEKRSLELSLAVTLFNLGGSVTYFDAAGSLLDKKLTVTANLFPLYIEPSAKIRFKGVTLGLGLLINPMSFLEYRWGPDGYYNQEEGGIISNSASPKRSAIYVYMNF